MHDNHLWLIMLHDYDLVMHDLMISANVYQLLKKGSKKAKQAGKGERVCGRKKWFPTGKMQEHVQKGHQMNVQKNVSQATSCPSGLLLVFVA